jgi:hypothetical protein
MMVMLGSINIDWFIKSKLRKVLFNDKIYVGEGSAKLSVKASFAELKDENLPFEKSVFASAVKKSLQDGISKI